ncbi:hypothetical protein K438DRAFT_1802742, partial [Mycena galopus ATCC 62051]
MSITHPSTFVEVDPQIEREDFDTERGHCATATFPIQTLPPEITAEIFLRCLLVFDPLFIPECKGSAPIVLSGVCREWRDIAFATPLLWTKLKVSFDDIAAEIVSEPGLVEGHMERWLTRAGNCPLSLELLSWKEAPFTLDRLQDLIHRWSHHIQCLHLEIGVDRDIRSLGLDSAAFPLLEAASLWCDVEPDLPPITIFSNAPRFSSLRLISHATAPRMFIFPWLQLSKFDGSIWDLRIFALAPNLTELTCAFAPDPVDAHFESITHHSLRSLTLLMSEESVTGDLIQYLTLPALQYLDVSGDRESYASLESFLARSSPHLLSLAVSGRELCFEYWAQCIPLVGGTLQDLEFLDVADQDLLSIFSLVDGSILNSVPRIRTVRFTDIDGPINLYDLGNPSLSGRRDMGRSSRLPSF